ncbi:MAG: hypothetical protein IJZ37_06665 [Clostridia bacterium]|nr:hypothetical protein [Clostridia bacterium]
MFSLVFLMIFLMIGGLVGLLELILQGVALMKLSQKMGVSGTWRCFIPFFNSYQFGLMAQKEQKRSAPLKKSFPFAKLYAAVKIVYALVYGGFWVLYMAVLTISMVLPMVIMLFPENQSLQTVVMSVAVLLLVCLLIAFFLWLGATLLLYPLSIGVGVLSGFISYYVYKAFAEEHAPWMMLLSLFVRGAGTVILLVLAFSEKYTFASEGGQDETLDCKVEKSTCMQAENVI